MVLEAFAALGLASNIVQFVDFSCKLVSQTRAIHESSKGASEQQLDLEVISRELIRIIDTLGPASSTEVIGPGLQAIARQCRDVAKALSEAVENLRPRKTGTVWRSFVQAMKEAGENGKVKHLVERVSVLQGSLNTQLLNFMNHEIRHQLAELSEENRRLHINRTGEIERLKEAVEIGIKSIIQQSSLEHSRILDHLDRIKGLEPVDSCDVQKLSRILCGLSENLASLSNVETAVESEQCLLNSLHFEGLRHRQDNVASAHKSTLQWLLTDFPPKQYSGPPPELASWLRDGHGIYWVRGKPGSGKSTLMRFLCENEGTNSLLRDWSQSKKLVIAPYFFWSPGTKLQRSQKGLLQSLLYEVLQRCPELISKVYKDPERTHYRFPEEDWSFSELKTAFSQLKKQKDVSARFCFFIDGLDEYDGESQEGTYDDLIQTIEDFVKSPDIKVCLSSRPWNVFRDAFGCYPSLALENLNRDDIDSYVRSTLVEDQRFVRLCKENTFYQELVEEIVEKAQGVFLWVYLVVRSLRKGLVNSDTVEILRERVRSLPSDLKAFFCQILDSVDDVYKIQTARTFKRVWMKMIALE
ncbi:hypothetical protein SLS57_009749 [Botryosphaeria dothidea]